MATIFGKKLKWMKKNLTYSFQNIVEDNPNLSQEQIEIDFQKACDEWSKVTGLKFNKIGYTEDADIEITWEDIDGSGDVLANCQNPDGKDGMLEMKFDTAEAWTNNKVFFNSTNFITVALHELGHAVGLDHSSNPDAVMYRINTLKFEEKTKLMPDDKQGAKYLYFDETKGIVIFNETDLAVSWFAFNSYDGIKITALASGNLGPNEIHFYDPVENKTGKYFIRITQMGGGTELAGCIVSKDNQMSLIPVGSAGLTIEIE